MSYSPTNLNSLSLCNLIVAIWCTLVYLLPWSLNKLNFMGIMKKMRKTAIHDDFWIFIQIVIDSVMICYCKLMLIFSIKSKLIWCQLIICWSFLIIWTINFLQMVWIINFLIGFVGNLFPKMNLQMRIKMILRFEFQFQS